MGATHSLYRVTQPYTNQVRCRAQKAQNNFVMKRQQQHQLEGSWEVEASFQGEADLHRHFLSCEKNPGHIEFMPVHQLTIDLLPTSYQDNDLLDFLRALSDLTVRVAVKHISKNRPQVYPGTRKPYPCYREIGKRLLRTGTGWVHMVKTYRNSSKKKRKTCTCEECIHSKKPEKSFAYIHIKTVNHVVFDHLEGAHTTCHLFFDTGNTPEQCSDAIALRGMSQVQSDINSDTCQMTYVTHDMNLAGRLRRIWQQRRKAHERLMAKYNNNIYNRLRLSYPPWSMSQPEHTLTFIVSHPHGCSKQISVGNYTNRKLVNGIWSRYTYTTATCSGSSGALVYVLGSGQLLFDHAHGGNCEDDKKLNYSSHGLD